MKPFNKKNNLTFYVELIASFAKGFKIIIDPRKKKKMLKLSV